MRKTLPLMLMDEPSARPLKVPVTPPLAEMIVNLLLAGGKPFSCEKPTVRFRVGLPDRLTVPVTFSWLKVPAVLLFNNSVKEDPALKVALLLASVPGASAVGLGGVPDVDGRTPPGRMIAAVVMVPTVPLPRRLAPLLTVTLLASAPLICKVP